MKVVFVVINVVYVVVCVAISLVWRLVEVVGGALSCLGGLVWLWSGIVRDAIRLGTFCKSPLQASKEFASLSREKEEEIEDE